eukprot:5706174-Alexandrium_andersonii.AAC.1
MSSWLRPSGGGVQAPISRGRHCGQSPPPQNTPPVTDTSMGGGRPAASSWLGSISQHWLKNESSCSRTWLNLSHGHNM